MTQGALVARTCVLCVPAACLSRGGACASERASRLAGPFFFLSNTTWTVRHHMLLDCCSPGHQTIPFFFSHPISCFLVLGIPSCSLFFFNFHRVERGNQD